MYIKVVAVKHKLLRRAGRAISMFHWNMELLKTDHMAQHHKIMPAYNVSNRRLTK